MTLRENILANVKISQRQRDIAILVALLGFLPAFLISFYWDIYIIPGFFFLIYLIGFFLFIKARIDLSKRVRCAICDKSLGYLFGSFLYRKLGPSWNREFPKGITCCPNCKTSLDKEIKTEQSPASDVASAPPDEA